MTEGVASNINQVDAEGWETVVEESGTPIEFENVGDQFVGTYLSAEEIQPDGWDEKDYFTQHRFSDTDGNVRVINGGFKLNEALETIEPGDYVRITRAKDVPMSDAGKNPMKDYKIEVKR